MNRDRIDNLLERVLRGEDLPADATAAEREEVARLVAASAALRGSATIVDDEAGASAPAARARFERFIAARPGTGTARPAVTRGSWLARLPHRRVVLAASAAAIGVLAVGAAFAFQAVFSTTGTANAEVLTANDYAQVQGVVTRVSHSADAITLDVQSAFGSVTVAVAPGTTVEHAGTSVGASQLAAGDLVTISGVAATSSDVSAQTVDIAAAGVSKPASGAIKALKPLASALQGKVVAFAVSPNGEDARVLLEAKGKWYVVRLEGGAVERLLARSANALGAQVTINNGANATDDLFSLTVGQSSKPTAADASLMGVRGVVVARRGPVLEVAVSGQQRYIVTLDASTRIVPGKSGLTRPEVRSGDAVVGHLISVAGAVNPSTGRITAELVVIGVRYQPAQGGGAQE